MIHQPPDHRRVDGVRLRKGFCKAGQDFIHRLVRSGHKIKAAQSRLKLSGFLGKRRFLQFQKTASGFTERPNEYIPHFLQFQIVRIRTLRLCRAVFLHTGAAFKKALAAAQNGFCRLPKLFQCVKGAFGFLLQFLFHAACLTPQAGCSQPQSQRPVRFPPACRGECAACSLYFAAA